MCFWTLLTNSLYYKSVTSSQKSNPFFRLNTKEYSWQAFYMDPLYYIKIKASRKMYDSIYLNLKWYSNSKLLCIMWLLYQFDHLKYKFGVLKNHPIHPKSIRLIAQLYVLSPMFYYKQISLYKTVKLFTLSELATKTHYKWFHTKLLLITQITSSVTRPYLSLIMLRVNVIWNEIGPDIYFKIICNQGRIVIKRPTEKIIFRCPKLRPPSQKLNQIIIRKAAHEWNPFFS